MLRRKLMIFLGSLVALMAVVAVLAIWLLQGVLHDLDHTGNVDAVGVEQVNRLSGTISEIEIELREIQLRHEQHLDRLIDLVDTLRQESRQFGENYLEPIPGGHPLFERINAFLPQFERHVGMLATTQDANLAAAHTQEAMTVSIALRRDILELAHLMQNHVIAEQRAATAWFRWLVLGLSIVFLLLINVSILMLMRTAGMVLKPVEQLVEASRQLGQENFDYRVDLRQDDEFAELARAYNSLAAQLQANEQRKLETLHQVAVTLHHELNNASAIIHLQLQLLERQSGGTPAFEKCLRQIAESCTRMTSTIAALKQIRRIVLTDYNADIKMLDLQKSVAPEPEPAPAGPAPAP